MKQSKQLIRATIIAGMSLGALSAIHAEEVTSPWSGTAGLGFLSTDGNSETSSLNANLGLGYEVGRWHHALKALAINGSTSSVTTAERYSLGLKSDFDINDASYFFGLADADKDRYSAYDLRTTEAVGYGRRLIDNDTRKWNVEIGAGATQLEPVIGENTSDTIGRLATDYTWTISETSEFTQTFGVESGNTNTYMESVSALKASLYKDLGIRLSYSLKSNSDVPVDVEKTDTFTAISLEYTF